MAEERMLNDEILLGLIKANSGGGGGGTSNYNLLDNLPQINGNTLTGNKSASDLDLVGAVDGKGLSTNDYTNADKAIVDGVTAALEGKQDALTAGNYISIANDGTINVTQGIGVYDVYSYEIKSINSGYATKITKRKNGVFESEQDISNGAYSSDNRLNVDDRFEFWYTFAGYLWHYKLLVDSNEHQKDEEVSWTYSTLVDYTETFNVSQDSSTDLATKGDVNTAIAGKQDILTFDDTPTDNSNNPVKSNGIYDALALKQDATDNSLDTEEKTIVGAINEHEGDIGSLKSGFTALDNEVNGDAVEYPYADVITIEDAIPANLADCSVKIEPVQDLHGYDKPWVGGAGKNKCAGTYTTTTNGGVTFTANSDGTVSATDTSSGYAYVNSSEFTIKAGAYIFSGAPSGNSKYVLAIYSGATLISQISNGTETSVTFESDTNIVVRCVVNGADVATGVTYKPMIRLSTETDTTFAPYTNICPITGHTEAVVTRDGVNLFDPDHYETFDLTGEGVTLRYGHQYGANTYTIINNGSNMWYYRVPTKDLSDRGTTQNIAAGSSATVTVDSSHILWVFCQNWATDSPDDICVRIGNTTAYEPYEGQQYTIALGDTIYGGTVDFDSGVMTVTHGYIDVSDITNVSDIASAGGLRFHDIIVNAVPFENKCSIFIEKGGDAAWNNEKSVYSVNNSGSVRVYFRSTTLADAQIELADLQIAYKRVTPTTIQLTPQQIQLLKGTNTLTASTGQISVTVNGVSGAIGAVQEQVNELADSVVDRFDNVIGWDKRENLFEPTMLQNYSFSNVTVTVIKDDLGRVTTYRTNTATAGSGRVNVNLCGFVAPKTGTYYIKGVKLNGWSLYNTKMYLYDKTVGADAVESIGQHNTVVTNLTKDHLYLLCLSVMGGSSITATDIKPVVSMIDGVSDKPITPLIGYNINELMTRLPKAPTTDGTYNLQVTVASGTPTYSWVSTT